MADALKNLYDQKLLKRMSAGLSQVWPKFDRKRFDALMPRLQPLEMKPRVRLIRDELQSLLPDDYSQALAILMRSLKTEKLSSFDLWPYTEFIQLYGIEDRVRSLDALKEITKFFTSEWAVRPFLTKYPQETLKFLESCARDKDVHVRRWSSEGSRPRLPWGERLHAFVKDPRPTLRILEILKFDEELYVRKSVSNHLNDIAKDHPALVVKTLARWKSEAGEKHAAKIDWTIRRSLRTLIKDGHVGALALIGVSDKAKIELIGFKATPRRIELGDRIEFQFQVRSKGLKPQKLVVDYIVHFVKANKTTAPKVFKLKTVEIPANGLLEFSKRHHIKPITTRVYYPGLHFVEIQINGRVIGRQSFRLG